MKHSQRFQIALTALALLAPAKPLLAQAGVQVFLGGAGQPGAIASYDPTNGQLLGSPAELQGLTLLPLDFNGRRSSDDLDASRARFQEDVPGASRIELPGRLGVLYRFGRLESGGGHTFGFLRIDPDGVVHRLAERTGVGALGDQDPYAARIALAPNGKALLACTVVGAGGDLFEVNLVSGGVINRTPHIGPLIFREQSLRLANDWLAAVSSRAILRSGRAPQDLASRVPGIGNAPLFTGELIFSPSGTYAMTTVGSGPSALDVWAFGSAGQADKVTAAPAALQGAGFLPEAAHGPFFAISDDGQWCAWTTEIANKRELFMRKNTAQVTPPETHVTSDSNFADTLEEIGVLGIFQPGKLLVAVGEVSLEVGVGIENVDFFEVQIDASGASVLTNLTQSSGQSTAPFLAQPQISPERSTWVPAAGAFLMYDDSGGGTGRLIAVRPGVSGLQVIKSDVKDVDFIERVGNRLVISLRLATGNRQHQLVQLPLDLSAPPTLLLDGADDAFLQPLDVGGRWIVFSEVPDLGPRRLSRVNLATGAYQTFAISANSFGPGIGLTPGGLPAFSFDQAGAPRMAIWPFGGSPAFLLQTPAGGGALLPGR